MRVLLVVCAMKQKGTHIKFQNSSILLSRENLPPTLPIRFLSHYIWHLLERTARRRLCTSFSLSGCYLAQSAVELALSLLRLMPVFYMLVSFSLLFNSTIHPSILIFLSRILAKHHL